MDRFSTYFNDEPFEVPVARRTITPVPAPPPAPPRAKPEGDPAVLRWAVNDRMNSRVAAALGWTAGVSAAAAVAREAPLPEEVVPILLLGAGDRLVPVGRGAWVLLDLTGRQLALRTHARSTPTLGSAGERLIAGNAAGGVEIWRLTDGGRAAAFEPMDIMEQARNFAAVKGSRVVLVSQEMDVDVHAEPIEKSMIELIDLDYEGGPAVLKDLVRDTNVLLTAIHDDRIVLCTRDRIYFLDFDLEFKDAWAGEFHPVGMSLDEGGNVYLMARVGTTVHLWKISPKAELLFSVVVPGESAVLAQPPVVGYDHTVYLVSGKSIMAVSPEGKALWQKGTGGAVGGALITTDDRLVTTEGTQIAYWTAAGKREVIVDCGQELTTPPVLLEDGLLCAASASRVFFVQLPQ